MGKLQLCVVAARNLANPQRIGMPDPYVRVVVCNDGGSGSSSSADGKATREQPHKTHVVDNTLSPTWNCTFVLRIADERSAQLRCEVWNRNVFDDDKMGSYSVSVANLTRGVVHDAWYTLVPPDTNGDDGGGATRTVVVGAEAQLRLRMLALDFGAAPSPAQAWMVTDDIAHEPVQRAIDDGTWRRGQTAPPPPSASHTAPATATATAAPPVTVVYAQAAAPPPAVTTVPPAVVYASPPMYAAYAPPPQQTQQQPQQPYYAYNTATAWQPQPYAAAPPPPPAVAAVPAGYAAMPATAAYYAPPPPPPPQQPMTYMPATPTSYYTTATTPPPPQPPQPPQPYATQPGFRY